MQKIYGKKFEVPEMKLFRGIQPWWLRGYIDDNVHTSHPLLPVDRIPSMCGLLIIQKWKQFVAIHTAERRASGL